MIIMNVNGRTKNPLSVGIHVYDPVLATYDDGAHLQWQVRGIIDADEMLTMVVYQRIAGTSRLIVQFHESHKCLTT